MLKTITLKSITPMARTTATRLMVPAATRSFSFTSHNNGAEEKMKDVVSSLPRDIFREVLESRPLPMREEFIEGQRLTTEALEKIDIGLGKHVQPKTMGDKAAYYAVKFLRTLPDTYFGRNHYMRAVMLETIAAVPGMVGAMLRHMKSLRRMEDDNGWISHLLHEAENERCHLMVWMKCLKPTTWHRLMVLGAQGVFFNAYFLLYLTSPKTAHRMCGYLEEEAVISYTHFLNDIDAGIIPDGPAPQLAIDYYNLHTNATVRDVVLAVRADEAVHRDANHFLSDRIAIHKEDLVSEMKQMKQQEDQNHHTSSYA